jgi:transcriptional regulator with GAF, ATPase, and Fis domain
VSKVAWVTRTHFGLTDGSEYKHPFVLSEDWTVEQMQIVWDSCQGAPTMKRIFTLECIVFALENNDWHQTRAAEFLGIPQTKLNYYVRKYRLRHHKWKKYKESCL